MIFAGFSLTSCDEKDNAIIDGQVYVKPEVQFVDGGAVVTATTISDINKMIAHIRKDVMEYAAENPGEPITIKIDAPALTTALSENTIGLPTAKGTNIIVEFANPIATSDDAPLIIQSMGVADNATPVASTNEVEINFAAGTSDIDLGVNMPTSTVTLKGATIDELVSKTASSTLIIESGVTVNWLLNKGGQIIVKKGAEVLGALIDYSQDVYKKGIRLNNVWNNEIPEEPTEEDYYYVQNGKVIKAEDSHPATIHLFGSEDEEQENVPEIIISDGAYAWITNENLDMQPTYVNITGEGNANMMVNGADWGDVPSFWCPDPTCLNLTWVNKLTNVSVDYSKWLKFDSETSKFNEAELDEDLYTEIYLPINSENCTFKAKKLELYGYFFSEDIVASTHKGSTFDNLGYEDEDNGIFFVAFPRQTDDRETFNLTFDSCEFEQASFGTTFAAPGAPGEYDGYKAYLTFDNSKIGGKAITKSTEMITSVNQIENTSTFYVIDGVTYEPEYSEDKWSLKLAEEE